MKSILGHLRHNLVGYAAILIALVVAPTSAYAVATIRSADIVDGQVMQVDLADDAVRSLKIRNGSIYHQDLAPNAVTGDRVADGSLDGDDIKDNTLSGTDIENSTVTGFDLTFDTVTGYDVNESTLGQVPSALQGGMGRYGFSGSCDPETTAFVVCSNVQITLSKPGRLFAVGTVQASHEYDSDTYTGSCRINTDRGPILASQERVGGVRNAADPFDQQNMTVIAVTDVFPAGTHNIWVECYQFSVGAIYFRQARITAVALADG